MLFLCTMYYECIYTMYFKCTHGGGGGMEKLYVFNMLKK